MRLGGWGREEDDLVWAGWFSVSAQNNDLARGRYLDGPIKLKSTVRLVLATVATRTMRENKKSEQNKGNK